MPFALTESSMIVSPTGQLSEEIYYHHGRPIIHTVTTLNTTPIVFIEMGIDIGLPLNKPDQAAGRRLLSVKYLRVIALTVRLKSTFATVACANENGATTVIRESVRCLY